MKKVLLTEAEKKVLTEARLAEELNAYNRAVGSVSDEVRELLAEARQFGRDEVTLAVEDGAFSRDDYLGAGPTWVYDICDKFRRRADSK